MVEGWIEILSAYEYFESYGESEHEIIEQTFNVAGGNVEELYLYFDNNEEDPTAASFKITRIDIIRKDTFKYEYNINNEGYTEQTVDNTYSYSSTSLPDANTITVRVTNSLGKQTTKTATYLKGIEIKAITSESTGAPAKVDVNWPSGSEKGTKQIKIGDYDWQTYTGTVTVSDDCTVQARVIDGEYKVQSETASLKVILNKKSITTATSIQSKTARYMDEMGNVLVVPGGFKVRTDLATTVDKGIVIEDSSDNQFVWVPIGDVKKSDGSTVNIEFGRYSDFSLTATPEQYASEYQSTVTISSMYRELSTYRESKYASKMENSNATAKDLQGFITNAIENGGYYIARYEASFGSGDKISSVTNGTSSAGTKAITNQKPAFKQSTSYSHSSNIGTVTSTTGMLWNYIRQGDASLACQNLYAGNEYNGQSYVESDLVNSYAWDTAIIFIQLCSEKTDYAIKRNTSVVGNTGTGVDIACNIYDMAGNLGEWTTEFCSGGTSTRQTILLRAKRWL